MRVTIETPRIDIRVMNDTDEVLYSYTAENLDVRADFSKIIEAVGDIVDHAVAAAKKIDAAS